MNGWKVMTSQSSYLKALKKFEDKFKLLLLEVIDNEIMTNAFALLLLKIDTSDFLASYVLQKHF